VRPLLGLLVLATLLLPAPALAGNDYPGGGLGAPAPSGPPVAVSDGETPPLSAADGALPPAPPTILPNVGPVVPRAPDAGGGPPASSVRGVPSVTGTTASGGSLPAGATSGRGPGAASSPAVLYPSAAQPTTSTAPSGGASVAPGQLYPSATQPSSSSTSVGPAALSPGQLYPSAAQPTTSSAARPIGSIGGTTSGSTQPDPNVK
jgi:hypothetical protein